MRKFILQKSEPLHSSDEASAREGALKPVNLLGIIQPHLLDIYNFLDLYIFAYIYKAASLVTAMSPILIFQLQTLIRRVTLSLFLPIPQCFLGKTGSTILEVEVETVECRPPFSSLLVWFI